MKKLIIFGIFLISSLSLKSMANSATIQDTTIISFSDNNLNKRVTVIASGEKSFDLPLSYNLNSLLKELGLDDEARKKALIEIETRTDQDDTLNVITPEGQKIQIITKGRMFSENQRPHSDSTNVFGVENDKQSFKDMIIEESKKEANPNARFFPKSDFGFYLGLNNYSNSSNVSPFQLNALRPWQSRFVAFSLRKNATLTNGENVDLALSYGPEFAIYNFMFENNNSIFKTDSDGQTIFSELDFRTKKSKLTVPYLTFPILLNMGLKKEKIQIGVGGYLGYRVGSHTKTKDLNRNKEKIKDGYNLNKFMYGLTGEVGRKSGVTFFFRYDLNKLFNSNQIYAKDLQAFSFGLRL